MKLKLSDKQIKRIAQEMYQDQDRGIEILGELIANATRVREVLINEEDWDREFNSLVNSLHSLVEDFNEAMVF